MQALDVTSNRWRRLAFPRLHAPSAALALERRAPWLLFTLALAARLAVFATVAGETARFTYHDSPGYLRTAESVLQGTFSQSVEPPYLPSAFRTPVYPLFLASGLWLFNGHLGLVMLVQLALAALLGPLVYRIARRWLSPSFAFLVALFAALDPLTVVFSSAVMSDALTTLLLTLAVMAVLTASDRGRPVHAVGGGVAMAAAALCHPMVSIVPVLTVALLLASATLAWRRRLIATALFLGAFGLVLAPWLARNWIVIGAPVLCTSSGTHLLRSHASEVEAVQRGIPLDEARARLLSEAGAYEGRNPTAGGWHRNQLSLAPDGTWHVSPRENAAAWDWRGPRDGPGAPAVHPELVSHAAAVRLAREVIASHPLLFLGLKLRNFARLSIAPGLPVFAKVLYPAQEPGEPQLSWRDLVSLQASDSLPRNLLVVALGAVQLALLLLMNAGAALLVLRAWTAFGGLFASGRSRSRARKEVVSEAGQGGRPMAASPASTLGVLYLLLLAASLYALNSSASVGARYRLIALPFLILAAGCGWSLALRHRCREA